MRDLSGALTLTLAQTGRIDRLPPVNEGEALFHLARFGKVSAVEEEIVSHESELEADPLYEVESIEEPE